MKKSAVLLLVSAMVAGALSGCGKADDAKYLKDIKVDKYVTLGQYKGIEVSLTDVEVTDEEVETNITNILANNPMPVAVTGAAEAGHEVNIDYVGKKDGVEFEGGTAEGTTVVLGSTGFIEDLDKGMIGMKAGEVKDIPVTFPEGYHNPDLAGQPAVFTVTMHSVTSYPEAKLTDEYVSWLTMEEQTNVAGFKTYLKEAITENAQAAYDNEKFSLVAEAVIGNCTFKKLPQGLVGRMQEAITNNITAYASMYGMDMGTYLLNMQAMTADQNAEEVVAGMAEESAKNYLAYQAIANAENMSVTDEEVAEEIVKLAESAGVTVEEYEATLDKDGYKEYLMIEKVSQFLIDNAVVNNQ